MGEGRTKVTWCCESQQDFPLPREKRKIARDSAFGRFS